ncbi:MAG: hypothetical protein IKE69_02290 [Thermoguttaceae bacterium]|nr:hypothetical protein [Thermoguttaceae bacterium]
MSMNKPAFSEILEKYKKAFPIWWEHPNHREQYKWIAVKWFQDNWNIDAPDFYEMLKLALGKTVNLIESKGVQGREMIEFFARREPEEVRAMFAALYDESLPVFDRMAGFKDRAQALLEKFGEGKKVHGQTENVMSVYLWLRYPDKYYIYRYELMKKFAKTVFPDYPFVSGHYRENLENCAKLFQHINNKYIKTDPELAGMLKERLTDDCYPDPERVTLTFDIAYFVYRDCKLNV